jgi:hypothetical protein
LIRPEMKKISRKEWVNESTTSNKWNWMSC